MWLRDYHFFRPEVFRQTGMRTYDGVWADFDARHDTGVNSSFAVVANYCSELIPLSVDSFSLNYY